MEIGEWSFNSKVHMIREPLLIVRLLLVSLDSRSKSATRRDYRSSSYVILSTRTSTQILLVVPNTPIRRFRNSACLVFLLGRWVKWIGAPFGLLAWYRIWGYLCASCRYVSRLLDTITVRESDFHVDFWNPIAHNVSCIECTIIHRELAKFCFKYIVVALALNNTGLHIDSS